MLTFLQSTCDHEIFVLLFKPRNFNAVKQDIHQPLEAGVNSQDVKMERKRDTQ